MGKTCLNKLSGNLLNPCVVVPNGVTDLYLMYPEDVTFELSTNGESISSATFASGRKSYWIEGHKQNIQITSSVRALEASTRLDISVAFKVPHSEIRALRALLMGRFYVMAVYPDGTSYMIGVTSPLECSASEFDASVNGKLFTITLNSPEGSAGNYFLSVEKTAKDLIISKAV